LPLHAASVRAIPTSDAARNVDPFIKPPIRSACSAHHYKDCAYTSRNPRSAETGSPASL
jgi:hypothetical protein